ncbi:MAG: hypothetical protein JWP69_2344 [Flaviaesturariibacter sp.]|nr:hypothetical protein [Flaviaesturariibacter sp.]
MNPSLLSIQKAAEGLLFISESEHPFEIISFDKPAVSMKDYLKIRANKETEEAEAQTLDYFFRNVVRNGDGNEAGEKTAERFRQLQSILQQTLTNICVYRIGSVQVDAFIVGELPDGSYAELRTLLIET